MPASTCRPWSAPRPTLWWPTSITPAPARLPAALTATSPSGPSGTGISICVDFPCKCYCRLPIVWTNTKCDFFPSSRLSPSFTFPHPITPVAYHQLLSQQRGLNAFGHTPPLLQPSPSLSTRQTLVTAAAPTNNNSADTNTESSQVILLRFILSIHASIHIHLDSRFLGYWETWRLYKIVYYLSLKYKFVCFKGIYIFLFSKDALN